MPANGILSLPRGIMEALAITASFCAGNGGHTPRRHSGLQRPRSLGEPVRRCFTLNQIGFENLEVRVIRSIWHQVVGDCKRRHRPDRFLWTARGKQPYCPDNLMKRYIRHVARAAGIHKRIGWHTFRHTFGTLLKANGEDVKTVQELLRHANSRIMLEIYMQAVTWQMRAAQSKVVRMMVTGMGERAKSA